MNNKTKPVKVGIIKYDELIYDIFNLDCYLYLTRNNDDDFENCHHESCNKIITEEKIHRATKYGITSETQEGIYYKEED